MRHRTRKLILGSNALKWVRKCEAILTQGYTLVADELVGLWFSSLGKVFIRTLKRDKRASLS